MASNMKFDLHCNLPYNPVVPNASLGYIKGFLSDKNIQTRNVYWNLLLYDIIKKYDLVDKYQKISDIVPITSTTVFLSQYLYNENSYNKSMGPLSSIFSKIIKNDELKGLIIEIKDFIEKYIKENRLYDVDLAGFTVKSYQWLMNYYIILKLKEINPYLKVVMGGLYPQSNAYEFLKHFSKVDFCIWGEGEIPIYKLLKNLDDKSYLNQVPNLTFREQNKIIQTFPISSSKIPKQCYYPFADHTDYFNLTKNLRADYLNLRIPIWGIRTCNWNKCKFCIIDKENLYVERSPEDIVKEIEFQTSKNNTDCIYFVDNDFGRKDKESFDHLLDLLYQSSVKRNNKYDIMGEISPLRLDRKAIDLMKKISIEPVQIGFEATTDEILKKIDKKHRFIHNLQALKLADEQDLIISGINVIMGIPSETKEDVVNSISNLKFLRFLVNKYPLTLIKLILYKGSIFFEEISDAEKNKWDQSIFWDEIKHIDFFDPASKYEFFGFNKPLTHDYLWKYFDYLLNYYISLKSSYKWIIKTGGSSVINTKEGEYYLDEIETEILSYCDTIRTYVELKSHFQNLNDEQLQNSLSLLYEIGLLYCEKDFIRLLSVVSCKKRLSAT